MLINHFYQIYFFKNLTLHILNYFVLILFNMTRNIFAYINKDET